MDKNRNPIRQNGSKNVFCVYYGECLDDAVKKSWGERGLTPENFCQMKIRIFYGD
jgi:hypothetical protein